MEAHILPFDQISVLNDAHMNSLSAEPLFARILQSIGFGETEVPNIWALGGFLVALLATVASVLAGARIVKLKILQKESDQQASVSPAETSSSIALDGAPTLSETRNQAIHETLKHETQPFVAREHDRLAMPRNQEMILWKADNTSTLHEPGNSLVRSVPCPFSDLSVVEEWWSVPELFRPLVESFLGIEDLGQSEQDEILNRYLMDVWELGKSKLKEWQKDNLPSLMVRGAYNHPLFGKQNVVRLWDNLKDKALKTFYDQRALVSAFDSEAVLSLGQVSAPRVPVQGLPSEYSNTVITGGHVGGSSARTVLNLWDTRMGRNPAISHVVDQARNFGVKPGKLHKLYVQHDADKLSIHELRMLGQGPIDTLSLQQYVADRTQHVKQDRSLLFDLAFEEVAEAEDRTWWDDDAVILSSDGGSKSDEDEYCDEVIDSVTDNGSTENSKSVVSWCFEAVKTISSSFSK